jgi:hypothetical protein
MTDLTRKQQVEVKIQKLKNQLEDLHVCLEQTAELLESFFSMAFDLEFDISISKVKYERTAKELNAVSSKAKAESKPKVPRKQKAKSASVSLPSLKIGEEIPFDGSENIN